MTTILQPQPTEESPYVVGDYPYGFRLRTQIRYWVETTKNGQRLVSQTRDPRNGRWNRPKASTYSNIVLAGLDERNRVVNLGISTYSLDEARAYQENYGRYLSDYQGKELTNMIKLLEVYGQVEYKTAVKKFRDVRTGEIMTSVPMLSLPYVVEVNDLGDPVDEEAEKNIDRDVTRAVNIKAIKNAASATDMKSAIGTFKRST